MKRRDIVLGLGSAIALSGAVLPGQLLAQTAAGVARVGLLNSGAANAGPFEGPLIRGLAKHDYVPDQNLALERRGAEGKADRLPSLIDELVGSKVEVIVTLGYEPAITAKQRTTLPVVVFSARDPVATGLVDSLSRPGGHITGISDVSAEVTPKRMELLKSVVPGLRRVAVLWNADDLAMTLRYVASEAGARALGVSVQLLGVREPADFDQAFKAMDQNPPDALLLVSDPLTNLNRKLVFEFAEKIPVRISRGKMEKRLAGYSPRSCPIGKPLPGPARCLGAS